MRIYYYFYYYFYIFLGILGYPNLLSATAAHHCIGVVIGSQAHCLHNSTIHNGQTIAMRRMKI